MSDASVLSHEYKAASELSQAISDSLIAIKKTRLLGEPLPGSDLAGMRSSRLQLAAILDVLVNSLQGRSGIQGEQPRIPGAFVARVRADHQGDLGYFLEDLLAVSGRLRAESSKLTDDDLSFLDQLAAVADVEASSVFRRLMRI